MWLKGSSEVDARYFFICTTPYIAGSLAFFPLGCTLQTFYKLEMLLHSF